MTCTRAENLPRRVHSDQLDCHPQLEAVVRKHLANAFRKPYADHNREAFDGAARWLAAQGRPLILDSFCGVGESTFHLARQFPDHAVIGIDKSAHRLGKHTALFARRPDNYLLLRADIDDVWRLAVEAGWRPQRHFLLYPNPWPKSAHLLRRVHGSPLFAALLALGGQVEVRSNWRLYVEEFARALGIAGRDGATGPYHPARTLTPFERKYHNAGQALWVCRSVL